MKKLILLAGVAAFAFTVPAPAAGQTEAPASAGELQIDAMMRQIEMLKKVKAALSAPHCGDGTRRCLDKAKRIRAEFQAREIVRGMTDEEVERALRSLDISPAEALK